MPHVSFKVFGDLERFPAEILDLPANIEYAVVGPIIMYLHGTPEPQSYSVLSTILGRWTVVESPEEIHRRFSDARLRANQGVTRGTSPYPSSIGSPERLTEWGPPDVSTGTASDLSTPPIPNRVIDGMPQPNDPALRKRNTWPHSAA